MRHHHHVIKNIAFSNQGLYKHANYSCYFSFRYNSFCCRFSTSTGKRTEQGQGPKLKLNRDNVSKAPPSNDRLPFYKKPELRENIYTIPNALTASRILLSPVIGVAIVNESFSLSLGLLVFAGITDALDGWIARRFNMTSAIGSVLDPAADKILMTTLVVSLTLASALPVSLAALIIGRDLFLTARTAYFRYQTLQVPKTWARYWDFSLVTAEVKPPLISKINTALQLLLMAASLTGSAYGFLEHPLLHMLQYAVATTTIWSGAHYIIFAKDTIKIL